MNKLYNIAALFFCLGVFSQGKIAQDIAAFQRQNAVFETFSVLNLVSATPDAEIDNVVSGASFATIDIQSVNTIATGQFETINVLIPYNGKMISVLMYKADIFNDGFHVDTDKSANVSYQKGAHYRGIVNGNPNSVVALNFFNNELNGVISSTELGNLVIGKLDRPNNMNDYIIYSDAQMKVLNGFNCGVKDDPEHADHEESRAAENLSTRCVTMYFEIDYDLYLANGSSIDATTNWMTSVFNNVQTLFNNDEITIALRSTYIWTEDDPYTGSTSADYLYQFNDIRPVFDGDIGQLVGIDPGGLGGVAVGINGLCTQNNFSYSDVNFSYNTVPTYSWTIQVITHELGHLLGSRHTHSCVWNGNNTSIDGCGQQSGNSEGICPTGPIPSTTVKGTIMSYCHLISGVGINFNNGFGPQPKNAILNAVNSATCLSTDCVNTCINTVADILAVDVTSTTATINWNDQGAASQWQVAILPINGTTPNYVTKTTPSQNYTGLTPNTFYKIRVRPLCPGLTSTHREFIFATAANWCNGVVISDTGGIFGDHGNMESYIRTMIPTVPNRKIKLVFTAFNLEIDYDYLYIYDGASVAAPSFNSAGYTGTNSPGTIVSTAPDGSLTLRFESDPAVVEDGYTANVSCEEHLGVGDFSSDIDFMYYPNPTNGIVNIIAKTEMTNLAVYNITGQLLYQNPINGLDTNVDISTFSAGTYFFRLQFGDITTTFKIVKM